MIQINLNTQFPHKLHNPNDSLRAASPSASFAPESWPYTESWPGRIAKECEDRDIPNHDLRHCAIDLSRDLFYQPPPPVDPSHIKGKRPKFCIGPRCGQYETAFIGHLSVWCSQVSRCLMRHVMRTSITDAAKKRLRDLEAKYTRRSLTHHLFETLTYSQLFPKETEIIESLQQWVDNGRDLTDKQFQLLKDIWLRCLSREAL